jgi:hypothetical protein
MRKCGPALLLFFLAVLLAAPVPGAGQRSRSDLDKFQQTLMASFTGALSADGKTATPRQRAMFMGYILNRQAQRLGAFEADKLRMAALVADVKAFLESVSAGENLWPVVEAGMRGESKQEVDALLGGSAYVEAVFPTLDEMVRDWRKWDYSPELLARTPGNRAILNVPLTFLQMMKDKRYPEALALCGGRCYEKFSKAVAESATSPGMAERLNLLFANLQWRVGQAGLTETEPRMARIMFSLLNPKGKWEDEPCIMILDNGKWKVARFID